MNVGAWVNKYAMLHPVLPFGGVKQAGLGGAAQRPSRRPHYEAKQCPGIGGSPNLRHLGYDR